MSETKEVVEVTPEIKPDTYEVRGVVVELGEDGKTVLVDHEEIPGYMAAMRMPISVKDEKELEGVQAGMKIAFRLLVTEEDGWMDQVKVLGRSSNPPMQIPSVRRVRSVDPLEIGDTIPNYSFTNELGETVSFENLRGNAVALTFIFTRCPFPTFCPRMSQNFNKLYQSLTANSEAGSNWRLLSLSFDVGFDTPEVLKVYAETQGYHPDRWSFLTGAMEDVDALTEQVGLAFARQANSFNFDHNLRTVIIDTQGKIQEVLVGNEWTVEELEAEMLKAMKAGVGPTPNENPAL